MVGNGDGTPDGNVSDRMAKSTASSGPLSYHDTLGPRVDVEVCLGRAQQLKARDRHPMGSRAARARISGGVHDQVATDISRAYTGRVWEVSLHAEVEAWFLDLCRTDPASADLVAEAIDLLAEQGPALGRPLVDRIQASKFHNMKELRPGSSGSTEVRMLFAFDPQREAIFLIAGDKSGQWKKWYQTAIPIADQRFEEHLTALKEEQP